MNNKKTPVLRLTVIFISVVIASGSILSYLSINNISNLKELTEKSVLEQQEDLAGTISKNIQGEINDIADRFTETISRENKNNIAVIKKIDTLDLISNTFFIDRNGEFLWPWFSEGLENSNNNIPSASFKINYARAERAEFIEQDFKKASQKYLNSFRESSDGLDSVKALNSLARLAVKMDDEPRALIFYSTIISKYYSVSDENGFPYVYYAIPQLMMISSPSHKEKILQEIEFCLSRMDVGDIPLNHSTGNILSQVANWVDEQEVNNEKLGEVSNLIQHIKSRLAFIDRNSEVIRESISKGTRTESPHIGGRYTSLTGMSQDPTELILINLEADYHSGFTISLDQLWSKVYGKGLIEDAEFEFEVELITKINGVNSSVNRLATIAEISPYFPGYHVLIKLKNEGLIRELVKRRSWIYGIALVLLLGGMILGVLLILRDISREEHLAQLRSDFVSNVTHELKTPLTSVQLFTESILLDRINSETDKKEYLRIILKETENLKRMINNILEFSKKERGKTEYKFKEVNVTSLVDTSINDLNYWLIEKGFTLQTQVENNVTATADPDALKQAIVNLLSNAIKFSRDRKEISVGLRKDDKTFMIEVEDKGIGISEDQQGLIFEAFYRVGQKDAEYISGTGLGLTVVKEIVEAHHGKILIESKLNEGSKFTIILKSMEEKT